MVGANGPENFANLSPLDWLKQPLFLKKISSKTTTKLRKLTTTLREQINARIN